MLRSLITDFWCQPGAAIRRVKSLARLHERWHDDLVDASVQSPAITFFVEELAARIRGLTGWERILHRNDWYQQFAVSQIASFDESPHTLFSFSYTARRLLRVAKQHSWTTIVDQIDPGPEEQRIVTREHERYSHVPSCWRPAPKSYWDHWREEMELCDRIVVNSQWSAECLQTESIDASKIEIVPLVYTPVSRAPLAQHPQPDARTGKIRILFLGQINLRKGIGRLIDAMQLLADDARFQLTIAGPSEIDPSFLASMSNVKFTGPLRRSEVTEAYCEADVFILPTLSDGYALTQLEALSYGLPVIASRHCGPAVTDGVNGFILPDLKPETIAATLVRFAESDWDPAAIVAPSFGMDALLERLRP